VVKDDYWTMRAPTDAAEGAKAVGGGTPENRANRATVRDVSELAGVSTATVSRALNGIGTVDPGMRERVLAAAHELNYRPDPLARGLRRKVNNVFGMLIPDIENPFFTAMVRGAEDAAHGAGYLLLLCNTDGDVKKEKAYLDVLLDQRVGGFLLAVADERESDLDEVISAGTPVVAVDRRRRDAMVDSVLVDNVAGAAAATRWLIKQGYTRVATIAGPERTTTGAERLRGYLRAMDEAGLPIKDDLVVPGDFRAGGGYRAAIALLDGPDGRPDAIFVANNQMTIGAVEAIIDRGLGVPRDVAVACFDQLPPGLRFSDEIATVEQPAYDMGHAAVQTLLRRIGGDATPVAELRMQPELHAPLSSVPAGAPRDRARRRQATRP